MSADDAEDDGLSDTAAMRLLRLHTEKPETWRLSNTAVAALVKDSCPQGVSIWRGRHLQLNPYVRRAGGERAKLVEDIIRSEANGILRAAIARARCVTG